MIKKIFSYMIIVLILLFSFVNKIDAEDFNKHTHIYHINSLNIDSSGNMIFSGFAFIDHMDNDGGNNLSTYIIAKSNNVQIGEKIAVTYTGNTTSDYYNARCQGTGCSHANISRGRTNCNKKGFSDCAYYNVDFTATVKLSDIINASDKSSNIELFIESNANGVSITSPLGVHQNLCRLNGGECDSTINVSGSNVSLLDIGTSVEVAVTEGNKRRAISPYSDTGTNFDQGDIFEAEIIKPVSISTKSGVSFNANAYVVAGGYLLYDSWVHMEKGIKITFGSPPPEIPVVPNACDSEYDDMVINGVDGKVLCNGTKVMRACKSSEVDLEISNVALTGTRLTNAGECSTVGTVKLNTNIYIHEKGTFKFGKIDSEVYAGRGFDFPTLTYDNIIYWKYGKDASGNIVMSTATIEYSKEKEEEVYDYESPTNGSCPAGYKKAHWDEGVCYKKITNKTCEDVTENLTNDEINGYKSNLKKKVTEVVKGEVVDTDTRISGSKPQSYNSNDYNETLEPVSGSWNNTSNTWADELEEGVNYELIYEYTFDKAYVKLVGRADAANVTYSSSKPIPNKNYSDAIERYFVPLNFPDDKEFKFSIAENNVSFLNETLINWNVYGDCTINITNVPFDCNSSSCEPNYHYRPIDLETPFPDGNIPTNWIGYNDIRLKQTYDNEFFYKIVLVNGSSDNSPKDGIKKLGRNDSKLGNVDYNDWTNINADGTNNFIGTLKNDRYFYVENKRKEKDSWCKTGYFNSGCDGYEKK